MKTYTSLLEAQKNILGMVLPNPLILEKINYIH